MITMLFTYPGGEVIIALLWLDGVREDCAATAAVNSSASEVVKLRPYGAIQICLLLLLLLLT